MANNKHREKYTHELLTEAVANSNSVADVLRYLQIPWSGGRTLISAAGSSSSASTGWTTGRRTFGFSVRTATRRPRHSQVDSRIRRGRSPTAGGAEFRSLTVWVRVPPAPQFNVAIHKNGPEPTQRVRGFAFLAGRLPLPRAGSCGQGVGSADARLAGGRGSGELVTLAMHVERLAHHELIPWRVNGGPQVRAVVGDRDRRRSAGLVRHDVERGEPVGGLQVPVGGPRRGLGCGDRGVLHLRAARADGGDQDPVVRHVEVRHRRGRGVAAATDDHVHRAG